MSEYAVKNCDSYPYLDGVKAYKPCFSDYISRALYGAVWATYQR